jgi:hypothetical protein
LTSWPEPVPPPSQAPKKPPQPGARAAGEGDPRPQASRADRALASRAAEHQRDNFADRRGATRRTRADGLTESLDRRPLGGKPVANRYVVVSRVAS